MEMEKTVETSFGTFYIRPYNDEDLDNVIELWESAFKSKIDRKIWRWKFHENPFGRQIMLCVNEAGLPVAMYAGIPFPGNWNGNKIKMTQLIDNMSHPDFRQATNGRKGLFIQTAEHFFDVFGGDHDSVYHYGFPGEKHFKLGKLFLKYSMVADGGAYLEANIRCQERSLFPIFGSVTQISSTSDDFDKLWSEAKRFYPFSIFRGEAFIKWRFFNHPRNNYRIFVYKNPVGKMTAYIATLCDGQTATIVDVFGLPSKNQFSGFFRKIKNKLHCQGISCIRIWLPKHSFLTNYLLSSGFISKEEPLGIIPTGRSFSDSLDIDFTIKNIFYTMADGDLF